MGSTKSKSKHLRDMSIAEMQDHLLKLRRDQFDNRFQAATRQLENTASLSRDRRELARTMTVLKEKQLQEL